MSDDDIPDITFKKAELIHYGNIFVADSIKLPRNISQSTAGPGAGKRALALSFGGTKIKLGISNDKNTKFSLSKSQLGFQILKDGEVYIPFVEVIPTLLHAPNQAFVNLQDGCIYNCEFCATPKLDKEHRKVKSQEQVINMIMEASNKKDFHSVAITSGILDSPQETVSEILGVIKKVKENLGDVDIGVEPYIQKSEDIDRLLKAGATEVKINLETFDRDIFKIVCPELDYDHILEMLKHAVDVFGRGKVATNIIIGLGETDENVLKGVEHFARMGIVAVIRVLRINDYNYARMVLALGHDLEKVAPERMISLAVKQKAILKRYNLSPRSFETMCHKCGCCDIVPFTDV
jgi:biotin synthase-related radical SAM superfamily protein